MHEAGARASRHMPCGSGALLACMVTVAAAAEVADPTKALMYGFTGPRDRDAYPDAAAMQHVACFWVSDRYKFIGVKLAKVGGSSLVKFLKSALCGVTVHGAHDTAAACADLHLLDHGQREGSDCVHELPPREKWRDYFVFGFVRNPYARRASMVRYCNIGGGELARGMPLAAGCGRCSRIHCAPAAAALSVRGHAGTPLLRRNASLVDFVGHTETLREDLERVLHAVQARAGRAIAWRNATPAGGTSLRANAASPAPSVRSRRGRWARAREFLGRTASTPKRLLRPRRGSGLSYEAWMATCGERCVAQVRRDYAADVALFGYPPPDLGRGADEAAHEGAADRAAAAAAVLVLASTALPFLLVVGHWWRQPGSEAFD